MKLLFDENLSTRLVVLLAGEHAGSIHVEHALKRRCTDSDIWEYARANGYTITSKDNDFRQRAFLSAPPPKVIWLDVGNAGTELISTLLRERNANLQRFGASQDEALLVVTRVMKDSA